jgi:hypothetical protein
LTFFPAYLAALNPLHGLEGAVRLQAVTQFANALFLRAMVAAEEGAIFLQSVAEDTDTPIQVSSQQKPRHLVA